MPLNMRAMSIEPGRCADRRAACWIVLWATRFRLCCGTKYAAAFLQAGCRQSPCASSSNGNARSRHLFRSNIGRSMPNSTPANEKTEFTARFIGIDGVKATCRIQSMLHRCPTSRDGRGRGGARRRPAWSVQNVEKKERRRNATAPFTTSKLQQDASRQLRLQCQAHHGCCAAFV